MNVLVLNCDFGKNKETDGGEILKAIIEKLNHTATLLKIFDNQLPTFGELKQFNKVLITGSKASVYDKTNEWIPKLEELIREIDKLEIPTLGICFGMQIITQALGGRVEKNTVFEEGFREIELNEKGIESKLFKGIPRKVKVYESHGDHATQIPIGAKLLAKNNVSLQAYSLRNFYCMQFHPEITTGVVEAISKRDSKDVNKLLNGVDKTYSMPLKVIENFLEN